MRPATIAAASTASWNRSGSSRRADPPASSRTTICIGISRHLITVRSATEPSSGDGRPKPGQRGGSMHRAFDDEGARSLGERYVAQTATELWSGWPSVCFGKLGSIPTYRLIDMAGGEIGIVEDDRERIDAGAPLTLPTGGPAPVVAVFAAGFGQRGGAVQTPPAAGGTAPVVDVYDDEFGQEGGVVATLAVDDGTA